MNTNFVRVLHPSRRKTLGVFGICCAFTVGGVWMVSEGQWLGWIAAGFFGLGVAVSAVQLVPNSASLTLSPSGFKMRSLFRSSTYQWSQVDGFAVAYIGLNKMVVFNFAPNVPGFAKLRRVATAISGWEGALPDTYGLTAEELAALLNEYKDRDPAG